ncbi:hypothetical protein FKM82_026652 [Ascaphus truei]
MVVCLRAWRKVSLWCWDRNVGNLGQSSRRRRTYFFQLHLPNKTGVSLKKPFPPLPQLLVLGGGGTFKGLKLGGSLGAELCHVPWTPRF